MKKYIMNLTKLDEKVSYDKTKHIDKIGGHPTYLPPENTNILGYFVMEIYNQKPIKGREDVLCWQLYQDEFGGPITNIIEIPKGAKLNLEKKIPIRRWIDEYIIDYKEIEEDESIDLDEMEFFENYVSAISGRVPDDILDDCEFEEIDYVGIIFNELCPYDDLNLGSAYIVLGFNSDGSLVAI